MTVPNPRDVGKLAQADRRRDRAQARAFRRCDQSPLEVYAGAYFSPNFTARWRRRPRLPKLNSLSHLFGVLPEFDLRLRGLLTYAVPVVLAAKILLPSATEAIAAVVVRGALRATERVVHGDAYLAALNRRDFCGRQLLTFDADGQVVAISPNPDCAEDERPRYRSLPEPRTIADELRPDMERLEGQYQIGRWTIGGLNARGWAAASIGKLTGGSRGGSSPFETATKNVVDEAGRLGLRQKIASGLRTVALGLGMSPEQRDTWVFENLPCARGAPESDFGSPVAGALCSLVLFGELSPTHLSPAQRCLRVAAVWRQVQVVGDKTPEDKRLLAQEYNARIIARASRCLDSDTWSPAELRRNHDELDELAKRHPFNVNARHSLNVDPALFIAERLPGAGFIVADQLKIEHAGDRPQPVRLHLSSARQQASAGEVDRVLKSLAPRTGKLCTANCPDPAGQIDVAAVIAEIKDADLNIVTATSNKYGLFAGRLRRAPTGGYELMPPTRAVGSLNKVWLSLPIVRARIPALCNHYFEGVRNPGSRGDTGVSDCSAPGAMIPVKSVFAASLNLPPINFAQQFGPAALRQLASDFGLTIKPDLSDEALPAGFVLGQAVVATPATMLRNLAAIYRGANGQLPVAASARVVADSKPGTPLDLASKAFDAATLKSAGHLLQEPILNAKGTLRSLAPVLKRYGCDHVLGKTGTSESVLGNEEKGKRDKLVLAAFRCGTRDFVAFGMIGSPSIDISLGDVTAGDVVHIIEPLLVATLKTGSTNHAPR